jgi:hypothetical protein
MFLPPVAEVVVVIGSTVVEVVGDVVVERATDVDTAAIAVEEGAVVPAGRAATTDDGGPSELLARTARTPPATTPMTAAAANRAIRLAFISPVDPRPCIERYRRNPGTEDDHGPSATKDPSC